MEHTNICKFNTSCASDLICTNFIFETRNSQAAESEAAFHMIGLVAEGSGVLVLGRDCHSIEAGSLFFVPRWEHFRIEGDSLSYYYISYYGRRGEEYMDRVGIRGGRTVFPGYDRLVPFWRECHTLAEDGNIDLLCESVLLYSLANLRPEKNPPSDALSQIIKLTQEHFPDPSLSLSAIGEEMGYDPKYLSALFKKKKGIPYTRYLREIRIRHAIFLMEEGLVSIKNIALLSGFQDPLYFSKVFSEAEGISPKAYIARIAAPGK